MVAAGSGWRELARGVLWVLEKVLLARNQSAAGKLGLVKEVLAARVVPVEEAAPGRKVVRLGELAQAETNMQGATATVPDAPLCAAAREVLEAAGEAAKLRAEIVFVAHSTEQVDRRCQPPLSWPNSPGFRWT